METPRSYKRRTWAAPRRHFVIWFAAALLGCQSETASLEGPITAYRDRMLIQNEDATTPPGAAKPDPRRAPTVRPATTQPGLAERESLLTEPAATSQPAPEEVLLELPDPTEAIPAFTRRMEKLREDQEHRQDQRVVRNYERVVQQATEYLKMAQRGQPLRLSLSEAVQRAIENNYTIRIEAHNPAISQTQIVEAEAAFDVEFYLDTNWQNLDAAVPPHSLPGVSDTRSIQGGFRKLLPTGAQASVGLATARNWSGVPQQGPVKSWNPVWPSNYVIGLSQPLLRGFGLDVNRAQIDLRRIDYKVSRETFIERVRDTMLDVETAYWQLAQARRRVSIFAESTSQNYITYQNMVERLDHDATQVEVENSKSRWQTTYVQFLETIKLVRDAEDRLKDLLNDPDLKLSVELDIIPTETPLTAPTVLDHFAEVRTALDRRTEIHSAKHRIDQARVSTNLAKNAILPQLNLTFQYEVQGTGNTADNSFDNLGMNRFISYTLGASFSYNFGERRARAAHHRARLQESQAVVALNQITDGVVEEVNNRIRQLMVRYTQLPPALESVQSAERNLRALQARTQRIDPSYLQTELGAVEQLANTRSTLLSVLTDYNLGIVQLEKAKGTLLDYNNVTVSDGTAGK
jgi:outer membrane protein TolC